MPDIRHAIVINAPVDRIRSLVASPAGLAAWWAEDVSEVPNSGSVELGFFSRSTVYRLTPQPAADEIRWLCETGQEWAATTLVFRLEPKDGQTGLEFWHKDWADESPYFVSCNTVWGHLMFKLKDAAEGRGTPSPLFTKNGMEASTARAY